MNDIRSVLGRYARSLVPGSVRTRLFEILGQPDDGHRAFEPGESVTVEAVVIDDFAGKTYGAVHVRIPEGSDTEGLLDGIDLLVPANILTRGKSGPLDQWQGFLLGESATNVTVAGAGPYTLHNYPHNKTMENFDE